MTSKRLFMAYTSTSEGSAAERRAGRKAALHAYMERLLARVVS